MVVKLTGVVNGNQIIFTKNGNDMWDAVIPANLSGMYIVELKAEDDAGNASFFAKYILTVDTSLLKATLQPYLRNAELKISNYINEVYEMTRFRTELIESPIKAIAYLSKYYAILVV